MAPRVSIHAAALGAQANFVSNRDVRPTSILASVLSQGSPVHLFAGRLVLCSLSGRERRWRSTLTFRPYSLRPLDQTCNLVTSLLPNRQLVACLPATVINQYQKLQPYLDYPQDSSLCPVSSESLLITSSSFSYRPSKIHPYVFLGRHVIALLAKIAFVRANGPPVPEYTVARKARWLDRWGGRAGTDGSVKPVHSEWAS